MAVTMAMKVCVGMLLVHEGDSFRRRNKWGTGKMLLVEIPEILQHLSFNVGIQNHWERGMSLILGYTNGMHQRANGIAMRPALGSIPMTTACWVGSVVSTLIAMDIWRCRYIGATSWTASSMVRLSGTSSGDVDVDWIGMMHSPVGT